MLLEPSQDFALIEKNLRNYKKSIKEELKEEEEMQKFVSLNGSQSELS